MFGKILKGIGAVGKAAVPVVAAVVTPEALINNAAAGVVKHIRPNSQGKNDAIPFLNLLVSTGVCYAKNALSRGEFVASIPQSVEEGFRLMASSTVIHQGAKLATRNTTLRVRGKSL